MVKQQHLKCRNTRLTTNKQKLVFFFYMSGNCCWEGQRSLPRIVFDHVSFNLKFILRWDFCITLRLFILILLEQLCMSPIIMPWLHFWLLSFFLLRLCPRCSCIQSSLSLSLHSSLTEWGGSSASLESYICSETMTLAGKCSRSTNPFTSHALLLCFKRHTATDLFKYERAVFVSCSVSLLCPLVWHNEHDLCRQSSTACSWFSLIFCVCPQPIKRRSKSSPWCLCSAHAWTHALQKTRPTRQKVKNLLYTSTGAY